MLCEGAHGSVSETCLILARQGLSFISTLTLSIRKANSYAWQNDFKSSLTWEYAYLLL